MDEVTIGARLRKLRKWRGKTLKEVADLAGFSKSFLSAVERGQCALDRRSHIAGLATALRVSETDIIGGPHLSADPVQSDPHLRVPALREALTAAELGESAVDQARPVDVLAALVAGPVYAANRANDWRVGLSLLPDVLEELHFHVAAPADELALKTALKVLLDAAQHAAGILRLLGYTDLGGIAAARAVQAAAMLGDPVARGKAMFQPTRPSNGGNWKRAARRAGAEVARLEPHKADGEAMQVLGMLYLNASLVSAAGLDAASARSLLNQAADLAKRVPDDLDNWESFSATNVGVWRVKVEVELGQSGGKVLELAKEVDQVRLAAHPARNANFLGEVGRGLAREKKTREEAVHWLREAEDAGPQRVRNDARVHETVAVMLEQAHTAAVGRELRGMAARMGIPH